MDNDTLNIRKANSMDNGILNIRKAKRASASVVIALAGVSGEGKTYTALQLGFGLAGYDASKVGFLDTENKRGSLYDKILVDKYGEVQAFLIADLNPSLSPSRYEQAIREFEAAGVEVLIIDSGSHEWEGPGGCGDIAEAPLLKNPNARPAWNKAKAEHKKFVNVLLQSSMHIIICLRAREKVRVEGKNYIAEGLQPICEKNFMYECTASLLMQEKGKKQTALKMPEDLRPILGRGDGYITAADGFALRQWIESGDIRDVELEKALGILRNAAAGGLNAVRAAWRTLDKDVLPRITAPMRKEIEAAANEYDRQRKEAATPAEDVDALLNEHGATKEDS
jgi:hypothetical protein